MTSIIFGLIFTAVVIISVLVFPPVKAELRPRLRSFLEQDETKKTQKQKVLGVFRFFIRQAALFNRPLCIGPLGRRINRDLVMGRVDLIAEEFFLVKEIIMGVILLLVFPLIKPDTLFFWTAILFCVGYMAPEFWLRQKVKFVKNSIVKELPDTIDLLALCVNVGLDFMLALKWVVEKSRKSVLIEELTLLLQEINVGKPRRQSLSDLAKKYNLPDLSTFSRTLIQADRMGTSVAEALNILSEDMRLARYRRGEQIALKAPMKMLIPLLFFIFPVVGILVAAPVFLDFIQNNPLQSIAGGISGQ